MVNEQKDAVSEEYTNRLDVWVVCPSVEAIGQERWDLMKYIPSLDGAFPYKVSMGRKSQEAAGVKACAACFCSATCAGASVRSAREGNRSVESKQEGQRRCPRGKRAA